MSQTNIKNPHGKILELMQERIAHGLKRKSITKCSRWSEAYRMMGQPFPGHWSFKHHPWLLEMHDCPAERVIGQKSAQMGYTEMALNKTFFNIDILARSVLYLLPAQIPDAKDFSTSRFDPALELSPHLSKMFTDVMNIGHKRAGSANLFIRGSRSRSAVKSIPVGLLVADEVDEMNQANLILSFERLSGQMEKQLIMISTPTGRDIGINSYYMRSTESHFFFPCPHCSKLTELIFPECLVITADEPMDLAIRESHLICKECKTKLEHTEKIDFLNKGQWVPGHTDRADVGFYINQLYSMTVKPWELAEQFLRGKYNPADEQEFHNSKLGSPHEVEGSRISDEMITDCIKDYQTKESMNEAGFVVMGIDVGKWLHYEITQYFFDKKAPNSRDLSLMSTGRVLKAGKCLDFEELDDLMRKFRVLYAVIDQQPEMRKALEFANRFHGRVRLCHYSNDTSSRQIIENEQDHRVNVHRTSWLDVSLARVKSARLHIPQDIPAEWKRHIKSLQRIYKQDNSGNDIGVYTKPTHMEDHFAHARCYNEIALNMAASLLSNQDITESL